MNMAVKIFEYAKCGTCQKALKFLDAKKIKYEKIAIAENPPTVADLKKMLKSLKEKGETFKKLFNTSGLQYRELKISDQIKNGMTEDEALQLLSKNGMLIKRPFILTENGGAVGKIEDLF